MSECGYGDRSEVSYTDNMVQSAEEMNLSKKKEKVVGEEEEEEGGGEKMFP